MIDNTEESTIKKIPLINVPQKFKELLKKFEYVESVSTPVVSESSSQQLTSNDEVRLETPQGSPPLWRSLGKEKIAEENFIRYETKVLVSSVPPLVAQGCGLRPPTESAKPILENQCRKRAEQQSCSKRFTTKE